MPRYIDADALNVRIENNWLKYHSLSDVLSIIDGMPTVDDLTVVIAGRTNGKTQAVLDAVRPKGKWIPVTERLPDKGGTYLLWGKLADNEDCYCFIGDYDEGCEQFGYWEQQYDPKTLGCLGEDFFKYECVIAWMPLPEPYERGDV